MAYATFNISPFSSGDDSSGNIVTLPLNAEIVKKDSINSDTNVTFSADEWRSKPLQVTSRTIPAEGETFTLATNQSVVEISAYEGDIFVVWSATSDSTGKSIEPEFTTEADKEPMRIDDGQTREIFLYREDRFPIGAPRIIKIAFKPVPL